MCMAFASTLELASPMCAPRSVNAGTTATYGLNFSPTGALAFTNAVTHSCAASGLPTLSTGSFIPTQIAGGAAATNVTLSIATTLRTENWNLDLRADT